MDVLLRVDSCSHVLRIDCTLLDILLGCEVEDEVRGRRVWSNVASSSVAYVDVEGGIST